MTYNLYTKKKLFEFEETECYNKNLYESNLINKDYLNDRINRKLLLRKSAIMKKLFNLRLDNK